MPFRNKLTAFTFLAPLVCSLGSADPTSNPTDPILVLPEEGYSQIREHAGKSLPQMGLVSKKWQESAEKSPIRGSLELLIKIDQEVEKSTHEHDAWNHAKVLARTIEDVKSLELEKVQTRPEIRASLLSALQDSLNKAVLKYYKMIKKADCLFNFNEYLPNILSQELGSFDARVSENETILQNFTRLFLDSTVTEKNHALFQNLASHRSTSLETHTTLLNMADAKTKAFIYLGLLNHPDLDLGIFNIIYTDTVVQPSDFLERNRVLARLARDPRISTEQLTELIEKANSEALMHASSNVNLDDSLLSIIYKKGLNYPIVAYKVQILSAVAKNPMATRSNLEEIMAVAEELGAGGQWDSELSKRNLFVSVGNNPNVDLNTQARILEFVLSIHNEDIRNNTLADLASNPHLDVTILTSIQEYALPLGIDKSHRIFDTIVTNPLTPASLLSNLVKHISNYAYHIGADFIVARAGIHPNADMETRQLSGNILLDPVDFQSCTGACHLYFSRSPQEPAMLLELYERAEKLRSEKDRATTYYTLIKNKGCNKELKELILQKVSQFKDFQAKFRILPLIEAREW